MPKPPYAELFPATEYPLLRLLHLFIDLYEALQPQLGQADDAWYYQRWVKRWWEVWCLHSFTAHRQHTAAFYNARWWWRKPDDERQKMCNMLAHCINEVKEGRMGLRALPAPTDSCRDPWETHPQEEEMSLVQQFEPWNTSEIESSVTYAASAPLPSVSAHTLPPLPPAPTGPPSFLEPPMFFTNSSDPRHPHFFRSLAHRTSHTLLYQYSHRQRAIYGLD